MFKSKAIPKVLLGASLLLSGCSVALEATRPDPVDLDQFAMGQSRSSVTNALGAPAATNNGCDVYKLYTRGPGAAGKATIAATEAVADVFTLGLAEIATTPAEVATRNSLHTVTFCYKDEKLVSRNESQ